MRAAGISACFLHVFFSSFTEFVTFGPAKLYTVSPASHSAGRMWNGLTIIAQLYKIPTEEKKGKTRYLFPFLCFLFLFLFLFYYYYYCFFLHAGDEGRPTRNARCLPMSPAVQSWIQFNSTQFNSAHPDSFSAIWSARGHLDGYADLVFL